MLHEMALAQDLEVITILKPPNSRMLSAIKQMSQQTGRPLGSSALLFGETRSSKLMRMSKVLLKERGDARWRSRGDIRRTRSAARSASRVIKARKRES